MILARRSIMIMNKDEERDLTDLDIAILEAILSQSETTERREFNVKDLLFEITRGIPPMPN